MTSVTHRTRGQGIRRASGDALPGVERRQHQLTTTTIERLLLMTMAVSIPLRPYLPAVAGFSTAYIIIGIFIGYALLNRSGVLARTWSHPAFLAGFGYLIMATLMESTHPFSDYGGIFRIAQVIIAAICVASLCRDRRALRASISGYFIGPV